METTFGKVEELIETIKKYINNRITLIKLSVAEKTSSLIANLAAGIVVAVFFILFIVFASIALSIGIGDWIGKTWAGFLFVAFLYLLIGIVVWAARGRIIRLPLMNALIKQLFTSDEED
jgi:hypothetical protein